MGLAAIESASDMHLYASSTRCLTVVRALGFVVWQGARGRAKMENCGAV